MTKTIKSKARNILCLIFCLTAVFILSSCDGRADIDINTEISVDKDFSGTRTITVSIDADEVEMENNLIGGLFDIDTFIKENLPSDLTYSYEQNEDKLVFTFTLSFSDLDDYRAKVDGIRALEEGYEGETTVSFSASSTPFHNEIYLSENFDSLDLLIRLSTAFGNSEFAEYADDIYLRPSYNNTLRYEGKEYKLSGNSKCKIDFSENNYLGNCTVETTLNSDSTIDCKVDFSIYSYYFDEDEFYEYNGQTISEYMKSVAFDGVTYEELSDLDGDLEGFSYSFKADSIENANEILNKIFHTENESISIAVTPNEYYPGYVDVTENIAIDPSFYNASSSKVEAAMYCLDGDYYLGSGYYYYYYDGDVGLSRTRSCPAFEKVELSLNEKSKNKYEVCLNFIGNSILFEEAHKAVFDNLALAVGEKFTLEDCENGCKMSISGSKAEIENAFSEILDGQQFVLEESECKSANYFKKAKVYSIKYYLEPLVGLMPLVAPSDSSGLYFFTNENSFSGKVDIIVESIDYIKIILLAVLVIVFIVCSLLIVLNRKAITDFAAKQKVANTARRNAKMQAAYGGMPPNTVPVQPFNTNAANAAQSINNSGNETDEEELE